MPSLRDLIEQGPDALDPRDKNKKASDDFQASMGPENSDAPPEEGITEDSFIPNTDVENRKAGILSGALPGPPGAALGTSAAEDIGDAKAAGSVLQKLRASGFPESKIQSAAQDMRLSGSTRFTGPDGKMVEMGSSSPLGKELLQEGKSAIDSATAEAPGFDYSKLPENQNVTNPPLKPPKIRGEALDFFNRTGVDPTRKNALQTMTELRAKQKGTP